MPGVSSVTVSADGRRAAAAGARDDADPAPRARPSGSPYALYAHSVQCVPACVTTDAQTSESETTGRTTYLSGIFSGSPIVVCVSSEVAARTVRYATSRSHGATARGRLHRDSGRQRSASSMLHSRGTLGDSRHH